MNLTISRRRLIPIAAVTICLIILLPTVFFPATSNAAKVGPPGALSRSNRLMRLAAASPGMAGMMERYRVMDRTFAEEPNEPEDVMPTQDEQQSPVIWPWRYVHAYCYVKGSSFAPQKVDWYYWGSPDAPISIDYMGDCHFYIEYGAEYVENGPGWGGYVPMPDPKTITDQWKKGMQFNTSPDDIKAPYYLLGKWNWDCSVSGDCNVPDITEFTSCNLPDPAGKYDKNTGAFTTMIGSTEAKHWACGYSMEILTSSGADLNVFSPKPGISNTVTDLSITPNKNVKPEQMVLDNAHPYELRINMKGFGIKTPAATTQSEWDYVDWSVEGAAWHAQTGTGMWVYHTDPGWYIGRWSGPYIAGTEPDWCPWIDNGITYGCWGGVEWYHHNTWANYDSDGNPVSELYWPPSTPKALFPSSSVSFKFVKSNILVGTDWFDGTDGFLYQFSIWVGYSHKGISFITSDDISFSGPATVRAAQGRGSVYWDLELYGAYPDREYY